METFQVEPGDVMVFYTDGVVEARDPGRREWGLTRLQEALVAFSSSERTLDRIAKAVLDNVVTHVREGLRDDSALLLVRPAGSA